MRLKRHAMNLEFSKPHHKHSYNVQHTSCSTRGSCVGTKFRREFHVLLFVFVEIILSQAFACFGLFIRTVTTKAFSPTMCSETIKNSRYAFALQPNFYSSRFRVEELNYRIVGIIASVDDFCHRLLWRRLMRASLVLLTNPKDWFGLFWL